MVVGREPASGIVRQLRALGVDEGGVVMPAWATHDAIFDPATSEVSRSLGIVAQTFWRMPGVLRSDHVHAFAARDHGLTRSSETHSRCPRTLQPVPSATCTNSMARYCSLA